MRNRGELVFVAIGVLVVACSSSSGNSASGPNGGTPPGATPPGSTPPGSTPPGSPTNGPIATIALAPPTATVTIGLTKQFVATGVDAQGRPPFPAPTYTWTVSGGGTIGDSGLFQAGTTPGGPFMVTVASGGVSATAMVTVKAKTEVKFGETNVLTVDDTGAQDMVFAQDADLAQTAQLVSISLYVKNPSGNVRLGIYDASGPDGGPGAKLAESDMAAATMGWMTLPVISPVTLNAGKYWLAFASDDNNLVFEKAGDGTGNLATMQNGFGPMPDTFDDMPNTDTDHWSLYATALAN
ncbi:MAG TPA: hypothetical protein VIF62_06020 [Labilithrix sp.]|jgi:hypothetical protein